MSVALDIAKKPQRIPAVRGHALRKIVELIKTVEKALDLRDTGAIKKPLMTKSIESKLPEALKKEWVVYAPD